MDNMYNQQRHDTVYCNMCISLQRVSELYNKTFFMIYRFINNLHLLFVMGSIRKKSCALSCLLTEGEVLLSWYISVNLETACMNSGNSNVFVAVADSSQCNKMLHNCSPRLVSWLVATVRQQIHGGEPLLMLCLWKIVWDFFMMWKCVFNESAWGWKVRWKMSVSLFVSLLSISLSVCLSVCTSVCVSRCARVPNLLSVRAFTCLRTRIARCWMTSYDYYRPTTTTNIISSRSHNDL